MQPQSTRRWPITRHYADEGQYTADAASLAAAGWHAISSKREPNGAFIATWLAPIAAQTQPQTQPQTSPAARSGLFRRLFGR